MAAGTRILTVPLVLLSILVLLYIGSHDFTGSGVDVRVKVKSSTATSVITHNTLPTFSPATFADDNDGPLTGGNVIVNHNGDNHESSNGNQIGGESEPVVNNSDATSSDTDTIDETIPACCLRPLVDIKSKLTPDYFEHQRTTYIDAKTNWTGTEYEEWVAVSERLNPTHDDNYTNLDCPTQYSLLVLDQVHGYYLRLALTDLGSGHLDTFPYYEETPGLPRILLLGDSISLGIRIQTQQLYHEQANIQGAPMNCLGFSRYETSLNQWLGSCPWDLVQFNVGMHFHPKVRGNSTAWYKEYRQGIAKIVNDIRKHSPSASIVLALTTPSPFDSKATTPKKATCPHYNKFHKAGLVPAMNKVAISVAKYLGIIVNDRYSVILPVLNKFQFECDVHFSDEGYQLMAKNDWKVFSAALSIEKDPHR